MKTRTDFASSRYLPGLDGLRAIAVMVVPLYHFVSPKFPGPLGVLLFFVLSGFLITGSLLRDGNLGSFYQRRVLRIFPAFYFMLFLHVLLYGPGVPGEIATATYVSNYYMGIRDVHIPGLTHTWSLAVEEQFYLLWPLVLLTRRNRIGRLTYGVAGVIVAVQAYRIILLAFGVTLRYAEYAFEARADALLMGALLALLWEHAPAKIQLVRTRTAQIAALAVIVAAIVCDGLRPQAALAYLYTVTALAFGVVIVNAILGAGEPMWSWLNWAPLRYLGRISYGIYLYHCLVFEK